MMADDMAAFVQALGIEKPIVGGWSDGGHIALEIGMRYTEQAKGLIIGATSHRFTDQYFEVMKSWGITKEINFEEAEKTQFFEYFMEIWKNLHGEDRWRELLKEIGEMWWTPLDYIYDDFQKISCPSLVLLGDRDEVIPVEIGVEIYQMLPQGELAIVPNTGHFFTGETPQKIAQYILDFCDRCHGEGEKDG